MSTGARTGALPLGARPLTDTMVRVLLELREAGGQLTESEIFRKVLTANEATLRQLHEAWLCAWGYHPSMGAVYQLLTDGRMRLDLEKARVLRDRRGRSTI